MAPMSKEAVKEFNKKAKEAEVDLPKEMPKEPDVEMVKVTMVKHAAIWHPYQRRYIPELMQGPQSMPLDNWLQCQIDAGLVKVYK